MTFEGFPLVVGWELTLRCNLQCAHCGSSAGDPRASELSLDEALDVCEHFPELLVREVNFTGGEPLLSPHWAALTRRLRELGIRVKVLSNGLALDPSTVARLAELGVAAVGLSVDGLRPTHDALRGRAGLHDRALSAIRVVRDHGIPLTVITSVNATNLHELPALASLLGTEGVRSWQVQPVFHLGRAAATPGLLLSPSQFLELGDVLRRCEEPARTAGLEILPADSCGYFTYRDRRDPPWGGCPAGRYACGITSDGRVKGCLSLPDDVAEGDLRERDLWDIWFDDDAFGYTRRWTAAQLGPNCAGCEHGERCGGGCSAMSYGCTGRFHDDPLCFMAIERRTSGRPPGEATAASPGTRRETAASLGAERGSRSSRDAG